MAKIVASVSPLLTQCSIKWKEYSFRVTNGILDGRSISKLPGRLFEMGITMSDKKKTIRIEEKVVEVVTGAGMLFRIGAGHRFLYLPKRRRHT
jgi:hypothetical protein